MGKSNARLAVTLFVAAAVSATAARADSYTDYAVAAGRNLHLGVSVNVTGGLVGANQDVDLVQNATISHGARAGRNFSGGVDFVSGSSTFSTEIIAGARVNDLHGTVWGNVSANGTTGTSVTVNGNGHVKKVGGAGGNVNTNLGASQVNVIGGGTIEGSIGTSPLAFSPITLPTAHSITVGSTDITTGGALAPGMYKDLDLGGNQTLTLSAGTYTFRKIDVAHDLDLYLDLTGGAIEILVDLSATFGNDMDVFVNGTAFGSLTALQKLLAGSVYLETHSDLHITGGGEWFGTAYAGDILTLNDNLTTGNGVSVIGALYADQDVTMTQNGRLEFVAPGTLVPEPATSLLGMIALGVLSLRRRRFAA